MAKRIVTWHANHFRVAGHAACRRTRMGGESVLVDDPKIVGCLKCLRKLREGVLMLDPTTGGTVLVKIGG